MAAKKSTKKAAPIGRVRADQRVILAGVLSLLACLAAYWLFAKPAVAQLSVTSTSVTDLNARIDATHTSLAQVGNQKSSMAAALLETARWLDALLPTGTSDVGGTMGDASTLRYELYAMGTAHGLQVDAKTLQVQTAAGSASGHGQQFDVALSGTTAGILGMLRDLQAHPQLMVVTGFSLNRAANDSLAAGPPTSSAHMLLTVWSSTSATVDASAGTGAAVPAPVPSSPVVPTPGASTPVVPAASPVPSP